MAEAVCVCGEPGVVREADLARHRWPAWHNVPPTPGHPFRPVGLPDAEFAEWLDWRDDEREEIAQARRSQRGWLADVERSQLADIRARKAADFNRYLNETSGFNGW